MTSEVIGTVKSCFDNTKDGEYNYAIILNDETRLYYRGFELNPLFKNGDKIKYKIINTKQSAQGNPYTNISSVELVSDNAESTPAVATNNISKNNTLFSSSVRSVGSFNVVESDFAAITAEKNTMKRVSQETANKIFDSLVVYFVAKS